MEHALFVRSEDVAQQANIGLPEDVRNFSFKRRLAAFRILLEQNKKKIAHSAKLIPLCSTMANLQADRHRVTHGIWRFGEKDASKLTAYSFRPNTEFTKGFGIDALYELGNKIGVVRFHLTYPDGDYLPRDSEPFAFIHRSLLLTEEDRKRLYPEIPIRASPFSPSKKPPNE